MSNAAIDALVNVRRDQWGASAFPRPHSQVTHTHVEVHHDVYPAARPPEQHCRSIETDHLARKWNGPFYNLGLSRDGRLYELRGVGHKSYATALTVVLFGDYENDVDLTDAQVQTLQRLRGVLTAPLDWHQARHQRTGDGVASACPGRNVIPKLLTIGAAEQAKQAALATYTVVAGDTLFAIARRYATTWQELAQLNDVEPPFVIRPGQVLRVPAGALR